MQLDIKMIGDIAVVRLPGEHLDASVTEEFKRDIAPLLDAHPKMVFDLSALRFVDSAGVGALLSCLRRANAAGGDLKLFGMTPPVRAIFDIARMHRIFPICETEEEAVAAFEKSEA